MKITNYQALILLELDGSDKTNGKWRPDISEGMNTPSTTLHDNLTKLEVKKLVDKYEVNDRKKGRNRVLWYTTPLGKRAIQVIRRGME